MPPLRSFLILACLSAACGGQLDPNALSTGVGDRGLAGSAGAGASTSGGSSSPAVMKPPPEPTTLAELPPGFDVMVADASHLYVAGSSALGIVRLPKAGATPQTVSEQPMVGGLAVDDAFVYFTLFDRGSVGRVAKTGGVAQIIATNQPRPWGIAVDATKAVWACEGTYALPPNVGGPEGGQLASAPKTGGSVQILSANERALTVTFVDAFVYYGVGPTGSANGALKRVPKSGGNVEVIASGRGDVPRSPGIANGWIGWFEYDRFVQVPRDGGPVQEIVIQPLVASVRGGANTATDFYFGYGEQQTAQIGAVRAGTTARRSVISQEGGGPVGMVVDDTHVYWLEERVGSSEGVQSIVVRAAAR